MPDIEADLECILQYLEELDLLCRRLPPAGVCSSSLQSSQLVTAIRDRASSVHATIVQCFDFPVNPTSFPCSALLCSERAWLHISESPSPENHPHRSTYNLAAGLEEDMDDPLLRKHDHLNSKNGSSTSVDISNGDDSGSLDQEIPPDEANDAPCVTTQDEDIPHHHDGLALAMPDGLQDAVALRTSKILEVLDNPLIPIHDLANVLLGNALDDWSEVFGDHTQNIFTFAQLITLSKSRDKVEDSPLRLQARHRAISEIQSSSATNNVVTRILLQMETIKFATEWQEHLSGKGVRKRITAFYRMAFVRDSDFSYHFEGLTESAIELKLKELTSEYNQWRNKIGRVVTARNRLLRLYDMFGPAILLDPQWGVHQLVYGRSRLFIPVWNALYAHIRQNKDSLPSQRRAKKTLVRIMTALGGQLVADYASEFLEEFPARPELTEEVA